jgi:hypothetical protein
MRTARRPRVALLAALAAFGAPLASGEIARAVAEVPSEGRAAYRLDYRAPSACPTSDEASAALRARVPPSIGWVDRPDAPTVRIRIDEAPGGFEGSWQLGDGRSRTLTATRCPALLDALAVSLAIALDAPAGSGPSAAISARGPSAAITAHPGPSASSSTSARPTSSSTSPPSRDESTDGRFGWVMRVAVASELGDAPTPMLGGVIGWALVSPSDRWSVRASLGGASDLAPTAGARFAAGHGALDGCGYLGRWIGACVGFGALVMIGEGSGVASASRATVVTPRARVGLVLRGPLGRSLAWSVEPTLELPTREVHWQYDAPVRGVYSSPPATLWLCLGVEWRFSR